MTLAFNDPRQAFAVFDIRGYRQFLRSKIVDNHLENFLGKFTHNMCIGTQSVFQSHEKGPATER